MPARTDHDRRDAQHSARIAAVEAISRYQRRIIEEAYAHIEEVAAAYDGTEELDWSAVGRSSAHRALAAYGVSVPERAIETREVVELEAAAGDDPADSGLRSGNRRRGIRRP